MLVVLPLDDFVHANDVEAIAEAFDKFVLLELFLFRHRELV